MNELKPLRVMSFNVRQMDGEDGPQSWEFRKDLLVETIRMDKPDLLGTQENWGEQSAYILEGIPEFDCFGRGRYGDDRDKHNSIFYNRNRFSLIDRGEMWFSLTPEVPGSKDWEIPAPRMVTWGRLREVSGPEILMLNTHMPYGRGAGEARRQAALVILRQIAELPPQLPLFLTGDFNAPTDGEIYSMFTAGLEDAWKTAIETRGPESTLNGFGRWNTAREPRGPEGASSGLPRMTHSRRIDWILHRNAGQTLQAETITHTANGLYPSDHYPVSATFLLDPEPR